MGVQPQLERAPSVVQEEERFHGATGRGFEQLKTRLNLQGELTKGVSGGTQRGTYTRRGTYLVIFPAIRRVQQLALFQGYVSIKWGRGVGYAL